MQLFEGRVCPPPKGYIVVAVARFNKTITQRLLDGCLSKLRQHGVRENDIKVVWVPGAYEIPYIANYFAKDPECLAAICLGAVIKGETSHDEHINRFVSTAIGEAAAKYGTPVIFGILTCDTVEQAEARSGIIESAKDKSINPAPGNKGAESAEAALEMIDLHTELPEIQFLPPDLLKNLPPLATMLSKAINSGDVQIHAFAEEIDEDDDDGDFGFDPEDIPFLPRQRKTVKKAKKKTPKKEKE
ncbi:MAG: 6,7-dimethyl-8-ribityllumazine synthase [Planctomycetaceae bacterium]|jgi:6,7-dimethyl-8-ribityllumazine synthase|nr:6,7-dimethyl-8-ribityllumazine synthase [Planctomycetaceae bacterium]